MTDEEIDAAIKALDELRSKLATLRGSPMEINGDIIEVAIERACRIFGQSLAVVKSKQKTYDVAELRWAVFRVARQHGLSFSAIGRRMKLDHGTILYGVKRCQERIEEDKGYAAKVRALETACEGNLY